MCIRFITSLFFWGINALISFSMYMIRACNNGCVPAVHYYSHFPLPLVDSAQNYVHTRGAQAMTKNTVNVVVWPWR